MIEDIRKRVESGIGSMPKKPDEVGAAVFEKAKELSEQVSGFATGLLEWSSTARERLQGDVTDLVYRVVGEMGLASKKDVEALAARVARLEKPARASAAAANEKKKRAPAGKPSRRKPATGSAGSSTGR